MERHPPIRPATSTQFVIFNLFGDYIMPHGGMIWTNDLLHILSLLGISERAARSTLSRMKQEGWFETRKSGRRTHHILTHRGRAIVEQGNQRIFEAASAQWDGRWHLVVYTLPEEKRELRNELRKKLIWYGFGHLAPGTWISPHDRRAEIETILDDLAVHTHVTMFAGTHVENITHQELVRRCWDIPKLAQEYQTFIEHYQDAYRALQTHHVTRGQITLPQAHCFVQRFWLTYDFQPFPRKDPNLPQELLPNNWVGTAARQLFTNYRHLLSQGMGTFIDTIVQRA